ncbi:MAG: aminotransferase class V-fold PLP-dependent enzyme [Planctomycetota bacterium]
MTPTAQGPTTLREHWTLGPDVAFLNHGSFGAAPRVVLEEQRRLQDELEREPLDFLAPERGLYPRLDATRETLAAFLRCAPADLAFVRNATDGVNAVLRSFPFGAGDQIVVTDHGYNACTNAAHFVAERSGAEVVVARIPFPIVGPDEAVRAIDAACTERTRLLLVDHVTSPTGLVLPIDDIVARARERGIRTLVDAAHAPAMLPVDLEATGADYTTGNWHKWVCGPKVSGFLHVRTELQPEVRPCVISHAANTSFPGRSRFLAEFDWTGTFDPTPLLAVPRALRFLDEVLPEGGIEAVRAANHTLALEGRQILADALGVEPPAPESMLGSLVTLPLPPGDESVAGRHDPLHHVLFERHRVEVPVVHWPAPGRRWFRISAQLYNAPDDYVRLADALREELALTS